MRVYCRFQSQGAEGFRGDCDSKIVDMVLHIFLKRVLRYGPLSPGVCRGYVRSLLLRPRMRDHVTTLKVKGF